MLLDVCFFGQVKMQMITLELQSMSLRLSHFHAADRRAPYEHFCVNADPPYVRALGSVVVSR